MNKTNYKRRGFTLIETLVAMTIFFTVIMTIYFTWESIVLTTRDANEQTARTQRERVALRTIKEALSCAIMYHEDRTGLDPATGSAITNKYAFVWGGITNNVSENMQQGSFVARLPESFMGSSRFPNSPVRRVSFDLEKDDILDTYHLVMSQWPVFAEVNGEVAEELMYKKTIAKNVEIFRMVFWSRNTLSFQELNNPGDDVGWPMLVDGGDLDERESDSLPQAVRVYLALKRDAESANADGQALDVGEVTVLGTETVTDDMLRPPVASIGGGGRSSRGSGSGGMKISDLPSHLRSAAPKYDTNRDGRIDREEGARWREAAGRGGSRGRGDSRGGGQRSGGGGQGSGGSRGQSFGGSGGSLGGGRK